MRTVNQYYRALSKKDESAFIYFSFNGDGVDAVKGKSPISNVGINFSSAGILGNAAQSGSPDGAVLRYANNADFSFVSKAGDDLPFSLSFWMHPTSLGGNGAWIINKRNAGAQLEYQVAISNTGAILIALWNVNSPGNYLFTQTTSTAFGPATPGFRHVVITYDGLKTTNSFNIYLNDSPILHTTTNFGYTGMSSSSSAISFFNGNWGPTKFLKLTGKLDEFGIWKNKILTPSQVSFLYNNGAGVPYPLTGL